MKRTMWMLPIGIVLAAGSLGCDRQANEDLYDGMVSHNQTTMDAIDLGTLEFLNHPTTTVQVLDHDLGLDSRAARHLMSHRNGPDGLVDTDDDDLFNNIAEVDGIYWVGESTLEILRIWVESEGWIQDVMQTLGVYDGVHFTVAEGSATIDLTNRASRTELVDFIGLSDAASDLILKIRPLKTMSQLSKIYDIDAPALTNLKEAALDPIIADCEAAPVLDDQTALLEEFPHGTYLVCTGLAADGTCLDAVSQSAVSLVESEFGPPARIGTCEWEAAKLCATRASTQDCCTLMTVSQDCDQ